VATNLDDIVLCSLGSLQRLSFRVDSDGNIARNTIGSFTGTVQISGLSTAGRNTTLSVGTTAIPLPATPLTDRNALSIRNLDLVSNLFIGFADTVTATTTVGTLSGWIVGPNETYNVDIQDDIIIFGIIASGTIKVQVQELA